MSKPFDINHNYVEDLKKNEISERDGDQFVYLRGLIRLAHERGIKRTTSVVSQAPRAEHPVAVVTYGYEFDDGRYFEASADASGKNTKPEMSIYLTAIAESRAKARALRDAFNISMCSVEEIGTVESKDNDPIEDTQVQGIKVLMKRKSLNITETLELVDKAEVGELSELTKADGRILMKKLNEYKKK